MYETLLRRDLPTGLGPFLYYIKVYLIAIRRLNIMDSWTKEQWRESVGEEKDYVGIQILLLNDSDFYLKITDIYFNEATEDRFFSKMQFH